MKSPRRIAVADALADAARFDTVLDARSPSEFAEDHLPGAISTPVLDDAERARVGTLYKHESPFAARRIGAALVSRNIASLLEGVLAGKPPEWRPLVYCWRGGNRSDALATVLAAVGWRPSVLDGGYRAFRRHVLDDLARLPPRLRWHVIAGRTGSGKSLVLQQLAARGEQVLDLESLARHRGSVLGLLPDETQPSQKAFETALWDALRGFDPARIVFVESESRRVGRCHVPDAVIAAMRAAPCTQLQAPLELRARLLLEQYRHFVEDPEQLFGRLERLLPLHGHARVDEWKSMVRAQRWQAFVESLLERHYDPAYERSMRSNYAQLDSGEVLTLDCAADAHDRAAALLAEKAGAAG
ncbi:MAG TPA: tRNA 2-selenouridine(34) synthase MnmH [Zeimonas sp.]|nr:tRNA 2-selenouridine(34) synthase MnmH [Zeimonas sp.]